MPKRTGALLPVTIHGMAFLFALLFTVQSSGTYARPELLVDTAWLAQHAADVNKMLRKPGDVAAYSPSAAPSKAPLAD